MISFNQIPVNIRVPGVYVEIDNSHAFRGLFAVPTKILVIGQKRATGSMPALSPGRSPVAGQAVGLAGAGSMLAQMVTALLKANDFVETWMVALDDNEAGVAATGDIVFGGAVTGAGTLNLMIAGRRIQVAVAATDTPDTIATAVVAAIGADPVVPVTAAVDGEDTKTDRKSTRLNSSH